MNAEEITFKNNSFDLIYGSGILHHLDLDKCFQGIASKLKENGKAIFIEPLGHNYFINRYRNKTPDLRTPDEHPLLMNDFKKARKYFRSVNLKFYFLTILALPVVFKNNVSPWMMKSFNAIDRMLFTILPQLRKYAWQVLVVFENPKK
jgi:SAM-dependent methyltransferase